MRSRLAGDPPDTWCGQQSRHVRGSTAPTSSSRSPRAIRKAAAESREHVELTRADAAAGPPA